MESGDGVPGMAEGGVLIKDDGVQMVTEQTICWNDIAFHEWSQTAIIVLCALQKFINKKL